VKYKRGFIPLTFSGIITDNAVKFQTFNYSSQQQWLKIKTNNSQ